MMLRDVLIEKGLSNREISNQLFVTFHLVNIQKKMKLLSRAQLIVFCLPHMEFTA